MRGRRESGGGGGEVGERRWLGGGGGGGRRCGTPCATFTSFALRVMNFHGGSRPCFDFSRPRQQSLESPLVLSIRINYKCVDIIFSDLSLFCDICVSWTKLVSAKEPSSESD